MPDRQQPSRHAAASKSAGTVQFVPPSRWKRTAGVASIVAAALLAYYVSLRGEFILDDDLLLTDNQLVGATDGLYRIWFTTEPVDYWPLTNTSFWIEWRLWGLNPTGYHAVNLILHIASALLIWTILNRLSIPGAWLAALLFAVHPVNVESVAWISQRKNTLSMLFFLLSILWWLKADSVAGLGRQRSAERRWYWLSLLAFLLAMLSKGAVAILPGVLLLLAWWQRGRLTQRDLVRTAPFFLVAVVLAWVNVWFQRHGLDIEARSAGAVERLLGAGAVVWFYLYKALVPVNLTFIYPQWNIEVADWRWWIPLLAAVALTGLLIWQRHSRWGRPVLLAWLFFCMALFPVMGFTDVGFMKYSLVADRYLHIAIIGVVALAAAGWARWYQGPKAPIRATALVTSIAAVTALMLLSWQQSSLYADPVALYETTLQKNPNSWLIHNNLGIKLAANRLPQKAIEHLRQSLQLKPDYPEALNNMGLVLTLDGQPQEALEYFQQALRLRPEFPKAHNNLGDALVRLERWPEAIEHYQQSLRLNPDDADALKDLGIALEKAGRRKEAMELYQRWLRLQPDNAETHNQLGVELASAGRIQEAIDHYRQALRLKPDHAQAHNNLGVELANSGQVQEAVEHYRQALRLNPDYAEAYNNLGVELANAGRTQEAIEHYLRCLRLKPDYAQAENNLGNALRQLGRVQEAIAHYQQAIRLQPETPQAHANLAMAYADVNRAAEALASAERALELAHSAGDANVAQLIQDWLSSYRARMNGRQPRPQTGTKPPSP